MNSLIINQIPSSPRRNDGKEEEVDDAKEEEVKPIPLPLPLPITSIPSILRKLSASPPVQGPVMLKKTSQKPHQKTNNKTTTTTITATATVPVVVKKKKPII